MKHILPLISIVFLLVAPACAKKEQINTPQEALSHEDNKTAQAIAQQTAELSHEDTEENADDVIQASQSTDSTCDGIDFYGQCAKLNGIITFGSYPQESDTPEPIEWRVLDMNDEGQILILSKKVLDVKPYNTTAIDITWEKSTIRSWLNGYPASYNTVGTDFTHDNFINVAFNAEDQAKIVASTVTADTNPDYDTSPGNATTDNIFLLSIAEAQNYFSSDPARQADATRYAIKKGVSVMGSKSKTITFDGTCTDVHCHAYFWLRSPGSYIYEERCTDGHCHAFWCLRSPGSCYTDHAADVGFDGFVYSNGFIVDFFVIGVRPALWVKTSPTPSVTAKP